MTADEYITRWKAEEQAAHIRGWDFSPIHSRYTAETDLPWDYENIVRSHLEETAALLDMDTGGGEFLLSLGHPRTRRARRKDILPTPRCAGRRWLFGRRLCRPAAAGAGHS